MRVVRWLPALLIALVIWILSATPDLTFTTGTLDLILRKSAHVGIFATLTAACVLGFRGSGLTPAAAIGAGASLALLYAVVDELHQSFVPSRVGAPLDVAIDAVGVVLVSLVLLRVTTHRRFA